MRPDEAGNNTREAARRQLAARFAEAGLENSDLDARLLVCAASDIDHAELIRDPDVPLGADASGRLADHAIRRLAGTPIARILGRREFWGLPFVITPDVLDPRPETEGLVASVIDAMGGRRADPFAVLDLGVGSGAIIAALLHELPGANAIGIDRSEAACRVARRNLDAFGCADRAAILCANWADAISSSFDIVVSNPPYIRADDIAGLMPEVRDHDPRSALDGGSDGLCAYRAIVPQLSTLLRPGGLAALECGAGQGGSVAALMRDAGLVDVATFRDLTGHDRIAIGSAAC